MEKYDVVVIGSGAGLMVLEAALEKGLKCAIIEKAKFGGTCLTKGCIPSKMLVYPADVIREMEHARKIGLDISRPGIDWEVISARMWEQINLSERLERKLKNIPNLTVYNGSGKFTGPDTMVVRCGENEEEIIQGERFIIAAGARTFVPPIKNAEKTGYLTSETFFGPMFPDKPWDSLVIVGGGAISSEFAHIFSSYGTKVTVIERSDRILKKEEEEVSRFVMNQFRNNGIEIMTNSGVLSIDEAGDLKAVTVENLLTGEVTVVKCREVLVASGVRSNADTLALDKAGVEVDGREWIITNQYLGTSRKNIWAIGDINGKYQFRHTANQEARILSNNLFGSGDKVAMDYSSVPWTVFTNPQLARVGATEEELKEKGIPYKAARKHYSEVTGGRAMGYQTRDSDNGFIKVIVGFDRRILGVHIVGPQASVLLQPFVYLMNAGYECNRKMLQMDDKKLIDELRLMCPSTGTYDPINNSMVIHPSLNELTAWVFDKIE
ncbi:MAG: dihydrolipoyl dehydrogenase family protein [Anaerovoracaceae bacterium]|jgi:mycothione reductase